MTFNPLTDANYRLDSVPYMYVPADAIPSITEFIPSEDATLPTEDQIGIGQYKVVDNQTPAVRDPANWFVFDIGDPENSSRPKWMSVNSDGVVLPRKYSAGSTYGPTESGNITPGATFANAMVHGTGCQGYSFGGPRNLGYIDISDSTWWRINNYVDNRTLYVGQTLKNEAWKEGSLEFTLKPTKLNCTLISGALFTGIGLAGSLAGSQEPPGKQVSIGDVPNGIGPNIDATTKVEFITQYGIGPGEEKGYISEWDYYVTEGTGQVVTVPNVAAGINLTDAKSSYRLFKVDLVNGVVRVTYEVFYGPNKKYIEFYGKTNLVDGNWHHLVINRPSPYTLKTSEQPYGGEGCFEIWVDGILEQRDFQIKSTEVLPTPQILFNNHLNAGILNWYEYTSFNQDQEWKLEESKKDNYVGGIRDYIFRQSIALSPHLIGLNYVYAMKNIEGTKIFKAPKAKANARLVQPTITTSKPKVLKLYWNNLLKDKTKCKYGLEFDSDYDVFAYSMTHKNVISPTQTFNLDLNDTEGDRTFLKNVRVAVNKHVFIPRPTILMTATTEFALSSSLIGFFGEPIMIDTQDDQRVLSEAVPFPLHVNNMLFGGVELKQGDRVLLTNQNKANENGVWIYTSGATPMKRAEDADISVLENAHIYVEQGKYAGKTFVQLNKVEHIRKSAQRWVEVDNEVNLSTLNSYPIHTTPWSDQFGNQRFINVNTDIDFDYDIIAFMNYPEDNKDFLNAVPNFTNNQFRQEYDIFITNLKTAVSNGKSIYISSPQLAIDFGAVSGVTYVPQLLEESGDAQSASISPFESGEPATSYFDTHRNNKYHVAATLNGLTNKTTYIMSDFVTYSPNRTNSDYHIKYNYRQFGLLEGDEFYIPGLTTLPETLNEQLPGYIHNQIGISDLATFTPGQVLLGTGIIKLANNYYNGSTVTSNPYDDNFAIIAGTYGNGKFFINCVENGYAFSRSDYNTARIQDVVAGQNSETVLTAAWQYSTKRINKQNLYDFSENTNPIGQTATTNGGGGGIVQSQSHCSNGTIRKETTKDLLEYQSDLYPDFTEEYFTTTEVPCYSMTWLGLQWLAE